MTEGLPSKSWPFPKTRIEGLNDFVARNPTCCVFFFNECAERPPQHVIEKYNLPMASSVLLENIPWTTINIEVNFIVEFEKNYWFDLRACWVRISLTLR